MRWMRSWRGSVALLSLALLSGLVAMWAVKQYLQEQQDSLLAAHRGSTVSRVVLALDAPAGLRLQAEHLALRDFPKELAPSDSLLAEQYGQALGLRLRLPMQAGDLLLPAHLQHQDESSFSEQLLPGRRAMTIPVDDINSVSGLIQTGDLIDIYVSFDEQGRRVTAPLLQSVLVRATGKNMSSEMDTPPGHDYRSLTLDLAPEDALRLVAARQNGRITALLRHPADQEHSQKAMRGELAHVLGIAPTGDLRSSSPPQVLYGNVSGATVPDRSSLGVTEMGIIDVPAYSTAAPATSWGKSLSTREGNKHE